MIELDDALRQKEVRVPGSRRYTDFEDYLLPRGRWKDIRNNGGPPVAIDPDLDRCLAQRSEESHRQLATANRRISRGKLQNARIEDGALKFSGDELSIPKGAKAFAQKVYEQMPRVSLTDLLVEVAS